MLDVSPEGYVTGYDEANLPIYSKSLPETLKSFYNLNGYEYQP